MLWLDRAPSQAATEQQTFPQLVNCESIGPRVSLSLIHFLITEQK